MKIIIVGGVAGGASAAARARRLSENAEVIVFERGPDVSFANCGMPYHVGEVIADRGKLLVMTPARFRERLNIDVRVSSSVERIDRENKRVHIRRVDTGETYEESYDKLILAPGASPLRPPIPGLDLPGIHTLRNLQDMDRIKSAVDQLAQQSGQRAVVVGAGFIGLEMVENLIHRGVATSLIELQDQVLPPLDREMTAPILAALNSNNVDLRLSDAVSGFEQTANGLRVLLKSGDAIDAGLVVLGIGVRPENGLAKDAGLDIGERGGIIVNDSLQTSDPDIYAVGDAIQVVDAVLGGPTQIPLAGPANRQGRLAADHIFGRSTRFRGTQGTAIVGCFGIMAAMTGASEKSLRRVGYNFETVVIHPNDHAGYYPGAEQMTLKLMFDPNDGRILGAQAVGRAGVDKRIDVLAMAIQSEMTVFDLEEAELAYAPQFGSAKDPVNMLGFVASGLMRDDQPQISVGDYLAIPDAEKPFLLDVRTPAEFDRGQIPGAVNIPVDDLRERIAEVPVDRPVVVHCQVGMRGYLATRILLQHNIDARNLSGGYLSYRQHIDTTVG